MVIDSNGLVYGMCNVDYRLLARSINYFSKDLF